MRFTLYYAGNVKAEGRDKGHVHEIRHCFHKQLAVLWSREPLSGVRTNFLNERDDQGNENSICLIKKVGAFQFAPLVSSRLDFFAELAFTILRPGPPGSLFSEGGDIDNSLKTLFDALKVPDGNQLPSHAQPTDDETPFFCLLEDDKLIKDVSVKTDSLLDGSVSGSHAVVLIHVVIWATDVKSYSAIGLGG